MGIFPDDDDENEDIDDKFADSVLDKATSGRSEYVDVDDVIDDVEFDSDEVDVDVDEEGDGDLVYCDDDEDGVVDGVICV